MRKVLLLSAAVAVAAAAGTALVVAMRDPLLDLVERIDEWVDRP